MSEDFDVMPADVRALLRAERARVDIPGDARSRLADRLALAVPAFGPPHVPALTGAPPIAASALTSVGAKVLVALALGTAGIATLEAIDSHPPLRARGARAESVAVVARELAPHAARVMVDEPDVTLGPSVPLALAPTSIRPSLSLSPIAALSEERRLLDSARDAIVRGDPAAALAPTASHVSRFPRGVLAEERDALRIRALARLGRGDEARDLLARMRTDYPRSFLLEGAAADVEAIP